MVELIHGDCLEELKKIHDNSVDSIVTDPPYGLSFMGKKWDYDVPSVDIWKECLRVLKPGGYLLSFAGTRTQHRMAVNIEDAGFEIRDMIAWCFGQGFPKSLNIAKKLEGVTGTQSTGFNTAGGKEKFDKQDKSFRSDYGYVWKPTDERAKQWEGWGTALKPALEPITVARKPLIGTVAENVLTHGTGGMNIDGCRVAHNEPIKVMKAQDGGNKVYGQSGRYEDTTELKESGRWPANLIHDGSEEVVGLFPNENARFFYCAKASKKDRDEGLEGFEERVVFKGNNEGRDMTNEKNHLGGMQSTKGRNSHPTVKPTDLMRYLCRLVTPKGGTVLDPFMGSGSTGKAALLEGFNFIGIEREEEYVKIAKARIKIETNLFNML